MIDLDTIDRRLLGRLQTAFPLTRDPYSDLGLKLGIDSDEVVRRVQALKTSGIIRQIGAVLDARRLGYQSTLAAMKVAPEHLARAEQLIREHPGVSHGYQRDHDFNVWITLSLSGEASIETELEKLASSAGAQAAFALPAVKVFKLRAYFGGDGEAPEADAGTEMGLPPRAELSRTDRLIVNELPPDLPLVPEPFAPLAERLNMDVEDILGQCRSLLRRGIIRRFGAAVNHTKAGYRANAMACWVAADDMVDAAGQKLASLREVSHCYERKTDPLWRYNLFAMIHGHTRTDCKKIISEVSRETGLSDSATLFSIKEFKKIRIRYLV